MPVHMLSFLRLHRWGAPGLSCLNSTVPALCGSSRASSRGWPAHPPSRSWALWDFSAGRLLPLHRILEAGDGQWPCLLLSLSSGIKTLGSGACSVFSRAVVL